MQNANPRPKKFTGKGVKNLFRNLEAEQARNGLNNKEAADILGLSRVSYEKKKKLGSFTLTEAKKLAARFGVSVDYLFETQQGV